MSNLKNHLSGQASPYLLQHAENPVDWYPWCGEAFEKAKKEDKPVFLSIGYSTCHWCHVMAHESFEDPDIAEILNRSFVSVKVDREERPDIDGVYMAVCQTLTGGGGWPTSIFMTADQKPFFAGTYFPKTSRGGMIGFWELLAAIEEKWKTDRQALLRSAEDITAHLNSRKEHRPGEIDPSLIPTAVALFKQSFDRDAGGFGPPPKFPMPHNLLFLLDYYEKNGDRKALEMAEITLRQMYRGGLFDHIGYGFARYSTDRYFLVPHFEKMLYDNALLMMSYAKAFEVTRDPFYREVAEKTAAYVLREMTGPDGQFYCAQDADSDGVEGKYYVFTPEEVVRVLGEEPGGRFNRAYGITEQGNFEGGSIPNLLGGGTDAGLEACLPKLRAYRAERAALHLDDKVLAAWNSLMIAGLAMLYQVSGQENYLRAARRGEAFLLENLCEGDTLYAAFRDGRRSGPGFLDDYAFYVFALTALYAATLDAAFLDKAQRFCNKAIIDFYEGENKGFAFSGKGSEPLIAAHQETYDGAMPSGNSVMAYDLVRLSSLSGDKTFADLAEKQLAFLAAGANRYPTGCSVTLLALSRYLDPPEHITVVLKSGADLENLNGRFGLDTDVKLCPLPTKEYPLLNDRTTFYVCAGHSCLPPANEPPEKKNRLP